MVVKNKIYIGSWKESSTNKDIVICQICLDDIPREAIKRSRNWKDYVNFVVWTRRELWLNQETHWLYLKLDKR